MASVRSLNAKQCQLVVVELKNLVQVVVSFEFEIPQMLFQDRTGVVFKSYSWRQQICQLFELRSCCRC